MKTAKAFLFISLFMVSAWVVGQTFDPWGVFPKETPHQECTAIMYGDLPLEKSEQPVRIKPDAKGVFSLATVSMSEAGTVPVDPVSFRVAIKDAKTQTIWMPTDQVYQDVDLEKLLPFCSNGDELIFMPVDRRFGLLQRTVVVGDGC